MASAQHLEDLAVRLEAELKGSAATCEDIVAVLKRVQTQIVWTYALSQSNAGKALMTAIQTCASTPERLKDANLSAALSETKQKMYEQRRADELRETEARWWSIPPLPSAGTDTELTFVDASPGSEVWPPERVPAAREELFANAAQRFRVQANKKHRHPFLPSYHFDALLESGRVPFLSLGDRAVSDVLGDASEVRYVRNDESRVQREEQQRSPAKHFAPWDRVLPDWCTVPDTWIEPTPPPGSHVDRKPKEQYYIRTPTLALPGAGIRPSATRPQLISRALYVPVTQFALDQPPRTVPLDQEADYVPITSRLAPPLSLESARSLLGRVIQTSSEPPRGDAPPAGKKRKTKVNKFATQSVGLAWGLELDEQGVPDWMHCITPALNWQSDFVVDLTGQARIYPGRMNKICGWIGAAILDADKLAINKAALEAEKEEEKKRALKFKEWVDHIEKQIEALNDGTHDTLVEVGPDGTFVAGDLGLSKGEDDEFEAIIEGARPGVWRATIQATDDGESALRLVWLHEGSVDYDALPERDATSLANSGSSDSREEVGSFSVDSGVSCLFSKSSFEALLAGGEGNDRQAMIETLSDAVANGPASFVPCGVVASGDDGQKVIKGRRDEEGILIELEMQC